MHRALAVLAVAEGLDGQRQQGRLLLGEHDGDLPPGGAGIRAPEPRERKSSAESAASDKRRAIMAWTPTTSSTRQSTSDRQH
jgi:hypothetical protein